MERIVAGFGKAQAQGDSRSALVPREPPAALLAAIGKFLEQAGEWLARNEAADFRTALLELYFRCLGFARTAELYDERYATIFETSVGEERLRLFCIDPSQGIKNALSPGKSALFFSATLRPLDFYREVLGGDFGDSVLQLPSPFPSDNLAVFVQDQIQTDFPRSDGNYGNLAPCIAPLV